MKQKLVRPEHTDITTTLMNIKSRNDRKPRAKSRLWFKKSSSDESIESNWPQLECPKAKMSMTIPIFGRPKCRMSEASPKLERPLALMTSARPKLKYPAQQLKTESRSGSKKRRWYWFW